MDGVTTSRVGSPHDLVPTFPGVLKNNLISAVISRGNVDRKIQGTLTLGSKDTPRKKSWELVGGWL